MLIEEIMKRDVIAINPDTTIKEALELLQLHHIRHLPVTENDILVGLVTARNLRHACPSSLTNDNDEQLINFSVSKIMKTDIITAHSLDSFEDAAYTMYENHIGCLPILQNKKVVGIITETDILRTLIELTGIAHPSSHIEVEVKDRVGVLADIAVIFKENHISVDSAFVYPGRKPDTKVLVFRARTMDPRGIIKKIEEKGHKVIWPQKPNVK